MKKLVTASNSWLEVQVEELVDSEVEKWVQDGVELQLRKKIMHVVDCQVRLEVVNQVKFSKDYFLKRNKNEKTKPS